MKRSTIIEALKALLFPMGRQIMVCEACLKPEDRIVGESGDFSICDRCHASITSRTGVAIRVPRGS